MTSITRRTLIKGTAAGAAFTALTGSPTAFAQDKPTIIVGSTIFTERMLLSEMISLMLEDAGFPVNRIYDISGTAVIMEAIESGKIDIFPEYTGTAYMAVLGLDLPKVSATVEAGTPGESGSATPQNMSLEQQVYDQVKKGYDEEFDLTWLATLGYNNTYAMTVTRETAEKYDLETCSDLEPIAGDMNIGSDVEFPIRPDGLPGFEEAYGFSFGDVTTGNQGLMYQAVADGEVDIIASYSTDGRIPALDLVLLEDDKHFFPPYYAAPVIRNDTLAENPEIADVLNKLHNQFTESEIADMNYEIDENGAELADAARPVLEEKGLIGS